MATRTVTVAPSGGDYTSLNGALAAEVLANPDLTTDNGSGSAGILIFSIANGSGSWNGAPDTTAATVSGFTTSATYYLLIQTDANNRASKASWDTTIYALDVTTAGNSLTINMDRCMDLSQGQ